MDIEKLTQASNILIKSNELNKEIGEITELANLIASGKVKIDFTLKINDLRRPINQCGNEETEEHRSIWIEFSSSQCKNTKEQYHWEQIQETIQDIEALRMLNVLIEGKKKEYNKLMKEIEKVTI